MKKGIALVSLVTVITAISILTSVVGISSYENIKKANITDFAKELNNVENYFNQYVEEYNSYPTQGNILIQGEDINKYPQNEVENGTVKLLEIDTEKIGLVSLARGNKKEGNLDVYAFSPRTKKIYYPKGVYEYNNLSEELFAKIKIDPEMVVETSSKMRLEDVTIKTKDLKSNLNTLDSLEVNIPKYSTFIPEVRVTNGGSYNMISDNKSYKFKINPPVPLKAFDIIINYKDSKGKIKTYVKNIENIDKEAPVLNNVFIQKSKTDDKEMFLITNVTFKDDSKISKVKYVNKKVSLESAKEYILKEGQDVENSQITILDPKENIITIYVEDSASNYNIYYITLEEK